MSEQVKYEPLFGLQKPFDNGPNDANAYGFFQGYIYYKIDKTSVYCFDTDNQWSHIDGAPSIPFLAMRRIIRTPVWTKDDQKAGKLPGVGALVMVSPNTTATVTAVDNIQKVVAVQCENQALDILSIHEMLPIETAEEEAKRLREEWCQHVLRLINNELTDACDAAVIYDALLSGELQAPKE